MTIRIGSREVGPGHPCLVVAELGINHQGDVSVALEMVRAAKRAGADAVKVAAITASDFCTADAMYKGESQLELFQRYELSRLDIKAIADEAKREGLLFWGTPTSIEWARFLVEECGAVAVKIGSDDLAHHELICGMASLLVPVILSTGMATRHEIHAAYNALMDAMNEPWTDGWGFDGPTPVVLLACTSLYPCPTDQVRLKTGIDDLECSYGFSDHTVGVTTAVAAVASGACVLEKHFTLDSQAEGPDHAFSANPEVFRVMVELIRATEGMLTRDTMGAGELAMRSIARRSIVAARPCPVDTVITMDKLAYKRTGTPGLLPHEAPKICGKRLRRNVTSDERITLEDVE